MPGNSGMRPWGRARAVVLGLVSAMLVAALLAHPCAAATTFYWRVHNGSINELVKWSKDFSLPASRWPTDYSVRRWDRNQKKWVVETSEWKWKVTQPKTGSFHVNIETNGAAAVPKGTWLLFDVEFNTNDVGIYGGNRKYKPDPCPKVALKKSVDIAPGAFLAEIDSGVFYGGSGGQSVLGRYVPANTYLYVYQVNAVSGPNTISSFRLADIGGMFDSHGWLDYMHDGTVEWDYLSDEFTEPIDDEPGDPLTDDALATFDALGQAGVDPDSWDPYADDFLATFGGLMPGESSNILWGMSSLGPGMPSNHFNAFVGDGVTEVGNLVWAPIPEPLTMLGVFLGVCGLSSYVRRRVKGQV